MKQFENVDIASAYLNSILAKKLTFEAYKKLSKEKNKLANLTLINARRNESARGTKDGMQLQTVG